MIQLPGTFSRVPVSHHALYPFQIFPDRRQGVKDVVVMFWNEIFLNPKPWKESLAQGLAKNLALGLGNNNKIPIYFIFYLLEGDYKP